MKHEDKEGNSVLKKGWMLLWLLWLLAVPAYAQEEMTVYVSQRAMDEGTAQLLVRLLEETFPQADWTLDYGGEDLRDRVLGDRAPQMAICLPQEAAPWAREGLLEPMDGLMMDLDRIEQQVVQACVQEESLFMIPLLARHRQMAANRAILEAARFGYLLDSVAHPVWTPLEFFQLLEELSLEGLPGADLWVATPSEADGPQALVQALYSRPLIAQDGVSVRADAMEISAALSWLQRMVQAEMIVIAPGRTKALERFLAGETALFFDWTREEERRWKSLLEERGIDVVSLPYPSSCGLPVRSFDVVGVAVFRSPCSALALEAACFFHEDAQAQAILGGRAIWKDDSLWLTSLSATDRGTTLRALLCTAMEEVLLRGADVQQTLWRLQALMETMP